MFMAIFSVLLSFTYEEVFASPAFTEQFIDGPTSAYYPENYLDEETGVLNLDGVFYKSDGKTLDARFLLYTDRDFLKVTSYHLEC